MFSRSMALVLVAGCGIGTPPVIEHQGGQSGVANHPPFCQEDSRVVVVDPTVPADGFDFAAQDVIDALVGTWEGSGDLKGGGPATVDLAVAQVGPIEAVLSHLEDEGSSEGGGALGAPSASCAPFYDLGVTLSLSADPYLFADGGAILTAGGPDSLFVYVEVDRGDVTGTLQPPDFTSPEFWDRESLAIGFNVDPTSAWLDLTWWAINDDATDGTAQPTTGTGTVSTGTVEPSGATAPIGTIQDLHRL